MLNLSSFSRSSGVRSARTFLALLVALVLGCGGSGGSGGSDEENFDDAFAAPLPATFQAVQVDVDENDAPSELTMRFRTASGASRIEWNFDVNDPDSEFEELTDVEFHQFREPGIYEVRMRATNTRSDRSTTLKKFVQISDAETQEDEGLQTRFDDLTEEQVPNTLEVNLFLQSQNLSFFEWDCDEDGDFEVELDGDTVRCSYTAPGTYIVSVRGKFDEGDPDEDGIFISREITVLPEESSGLAADFTIDVLSDFDVLDTDYGIVTSYGAQIQLLPVETNGAVTYFWDFGRHGLGGPNGDQRLFPDQAQLLAGEDGSDPGVVTFADPGYSVVSMTAEDADGATVTVSKVISTHLELDGRPALELIWVATSGTGKGLGTNTLQAEPGDTVVAEVNLIVPGLDPTLTFQSQIVSTNFGSILNTFLIAAPFTAQPFELRRPPGCEEPSPCATEFGGELYANFGAVTTPTTSLGVGWTAPASGPHSNVNSEVIRLLRVTSTVLVAQFGGSAVRLSNNAVVNTLNGLVDVGSQPFACIHPLSGSPLSNQLCRDDHLSPTRTP